MVGSYREQIDPGEGHTQPSGEVWQRQIGEFIVAADKWWRTTGGVRRRCGVYNSVI
jgi:hypothetical protein